MKRIAAAILAFALTVPLFAQTLPTAAKLADSPETKPASSKKSKAKSSAVAAQPLDTAYTDSIIKNTTDRMFLTELVDHLPASARVPTPEKVLGYPIGTPGKLTYTKDQYRYYRELEKTTPRVKTFSAPEKSEEGREQMLVVVSDEANLAKLARYKEITAKLADPRQTSEEMAKQL